MAFRRWIYVFAAVALLASFINPVSAQTTMTCAVTANTPLVRAEDYTALAGDILLHCTGGVPTVAGQQIPKVDITVIASVPITSKLTDVTQTPAFNEALLLIDEPGSPTYAPAPPVPLLNCGNTALGAPYSPNAAPFTCDVTSASGTGGSDSYNGAPGHSNVFQGRQFVNSQGFAIQFLGIPVDAPGTLGVIVSRTIRITNIRVNAVTLNVTAAQAFSAPGITAQITLNGTNFGGDQILTATVGIVRQGLNVGSAAITGTASFLQCSATAGTVTNTIKLTEGFSTAFKVRNWRQIQDNQQQCCYSWSGGVLIAGVSSDLNQNVLGAVAFYDTESGFMNPGTSASNPFPKNPPVATGVAPISPAFANGQGIEQAGSASQGTRFAIKFSTIPIGSNPSVPLSVALMDSDNYPLGGMVLVCGTDDAGAGGVPGSCTAATGAGFPGNTMLIPANGLVVYEVAYSNPFALETASVNVSVNPTVNLSANPPFGGSPEAYVTAQAVASFAPFYAAGTGAGVAQLMSPQLIAASPALVPPVPASAPIPRFLDTVQGPVAVYDYSVCATTQVTNVTSAVANGTYTTSALIPIQVTFSENATVTGNPQLALNSGGTATYSSGSGTSTLTFNYTIAGGQNSADLDYTSMGALTLNGGTIADAAANAAVRTLAAPGAAGSLGFNKNIVIDTAAPTVANVTSSTANGTYGPGAAISIQVTFSESVTVAGTPLLALNSGGGATANYASGSGTNTLTFTYTVAGGQSTADLDYTSTAALTLNGGAILDQAANAAFLTLPAPGAAGSLGFSKNIVISSAAARAALRDASGGIRLSTYASSTLSDSGGSFASDPAVSEDLSGNAFITARDSSNAIWTNVFNQGTSTWAGWQFGGGATVGVPSIAVAPNGTAWIAARTSLDHSYWLVSYASGSGYGAWVPLGGTFATDPVLAACGDGSLYIVGKDNSFAMWSRHYIPGTGFQDWVLFGGVVTGKASLTCGNDNAAYIAARDSSNSNWIARVAGNTWTGWFNGGAATTIDPKIAALGGSVAVVILGSGGSVWRNTFAEGTGNGWQTWESVGGGLSDISPAGVNGELLFAGKALNNDLWWWRQTGALWTWIGNNDVVGALASAPK